MQLRLGGLLVGLLLMIKPISVRGKEIRGREEPELSIFREFGGSDPPEEDEVLDMSDFVGPRLKVPLPLMNPEGGSEAEKPLSSWYGYSFQPWPHGGPEEPVCRVKLERVWGQRRLEVVGLLTSYDGGFLKALSGSAWSDGELEMFGVCPTDVPRGLLASLQQVGDSLDNPRENRFLWLHLEEVKWEAETKLQFRLAFHEDSDEPLGTLQLALLIFYQGGMDLASPRSTPEKFLLGGEGLLPREQIVCLSGRTQYLVLQGSLMSGRRSPGQLSFDVSLAIRHMNNKGATLSHREAQDLLFGFDPKCFTRMTPAVLLLAEQRPRGTPLPSASFLAADGKLDMAPYLQPSSLPTSVMAEVPPSVAASTAASQVNISAPMPANTGQFLEALSQFVNKVSSPSDEPPQTSSPQLQLDFGTMEAFPHLLLNLSEKVALERLVRSEDPLVVLFPENSQALMEQHLAHWSLEGALLRQLLVKLRSVIQELKAYPSFQAHAALFRSLLAFCHYPSSLSPGGAEGSRGRQKIHSLLLLKALQAVRFRWQESRKASPRANRSTGNQGDYCQLQKLKINLVSTEYIILPEWYDANNCVGSCRLPLSTRVPDYYSHTIFLLHVQDQRLPLERAPCCVPVRYSQSIFVTFTRDQGMKVKAYPNMVAEECGCR
ncbi:muellerian-inhibiting factor isoform X1 [Rhineura floridana]|uniref:muellerian-inhibiting factor isoform X1 n=1 Tax=Rhineura floridana TaxID=261503 RepID=UPI002AC8143F|nr:muellerian-inhibiting factor isoform X1 [Rhineura floridana]